MNIPSLKKYCFILIMTFCQVGRIYASPEHPENKATASLSASSSPEEKRKMLQDLNNFGKNKKYNGDLKKHLPSDNIPLNNNLPSDMFDTFGTTSSSQQEILENDDSQNNKLFDEEPSTSIDYLSQDPQSVETPLDELP